MKVQSSLHKVQIRKIRMFIFCISYQYTAQQCDSAPRAQAVK